MGISYGRVRGSGYKTHTRNTVTICPVEEKNKNIPECLDGGWVPDGAAVLLKVVPLCSLVPLTHFPQLDGFV